ncbi:MAG: DUF362 domain-containing protein [Gemmatimonadota bacterium]
MAAASGSGAGKGDGNLRGLTAAALCLVILVGSEAWAGAPATGAGEYTVALAASDDGDLAAPAPRDQALSDAQVLDLVRRAVDLVGGMGRAVADTAHLVVIKPNITIVQPSGSGVVTDARLVRAVALLVHEAAPAARLLIAEGPGGWVSAENRDRYQIRVPFFARWFMDVESDGFEAGGYRAVAEELRGRGLDIACFDLNFDAPDTLRPAGGGLGEGEYLIAASIGRADAWINCPVMKTHGTKITCAMKNRFGILPGQFYGISKNSGTERHAPLPHEPGGLDEIMVDLWAGAPEALVVVDGIVGHEAGGLQRGEPVRGNLVLAGTNPVAVDLTAAGLMGFNPDDMEFAELAHRVGRGPRTHDEVTVVGDDPARLTRRFKKAGDSYRFMYYGDEFARHANYGTGPRYWTLLGPLPEDHAFTPAELEALAPVPGEGGWSPVVWFGHDAIDLDKQLGNPAHCAVYAFTWFTTARSDSVRYWAGSDEGLTVWIDGQPVYEHTGRRVHRLGDDRVPGFLAAGEHRLLVRAAQGRGRFEFSFNIGEPVDDEAYAGNRSPGLRYYPVRDGQ